MTAFSNFARAASVTAALAILVVSSQAQTIGCTTGGPGGLIPTSGTGGGGLYPTTPPAFELALPLNVASLPPGATVVTEVKFNGLTHTFSADLQFVLTAPNGMQHNILNRPGGSCDFGGNYVIVPECTGGVPFPACAGTAVAPGTYDQFFGTWPSGTSGINNTPMSTIPAATGTWTLTIYDWAGADVGSITSWDVCFGTPPVPSAPTASPTLTSPGNLSTVTAPVTLTWDAVACATAYDVDLDGVVTTGVVGNSLVVNPTTGAHTWSVRAKNVTGTGPYAGAFSFDVPPPPPSSTCVPGGSGGLVPTSGTGGGGTWPTVLPPNELSTSYMVTAPAAGQLVKVELNGFSHTFAGDLQIVLTDPTGAMHNIYHRPQFTGTGFGSGCDLDGTDYSIYESAGVSFGTCTGTAFPGGDYVQEFGLWNSGDLGIFNTPLSLIPVSSGMWTLTVYDWAGGDQGALTGWQLCFSGPAAPPTFCAPTGSGTTNGCIPTIAATGNPNVAQNNNCVITVSNLEGQKTGLIFYGISGQVNFPWCAAGGNSLLCVKAPTLRLFPQNTGGSNGQCDGQIVENWNLFQNNNPTALGAPWSAGDTADMQCWFRDPPACKTTFLSEGLTLTYVP